MGRLEERTTTGWIGIWIEWNGIQIRCLHKISKTGEFAFLIGSPSFVAWAGLGPGCCSRWPSPFRDWGECQRGVIVKLLNRPYHPNQILGHETYFCRFAHPLKSRGPRTIRSWSVDIGFAHPTLLCTDFAIYLLRVIMGESVQIHLEILLFFCYSTKSVCVLSLVLNQRRTWKWNPQDTFRESVWANSKWDRIFASRVVLNITRICPCLLSSSSSSSAHPHRTINVHIGH